MHVLSSEVQLSLYWKKCMYIYIFLFYFYFYFCFNFHHVYIYFSWFIYLKNWGASLVYMALRVLERSPQYLSVRAGALSICSLSSCPRFCCSSVWWDQISENLSFFVLASTQWSTIFDAIPRSELKAGSFFAELSCGSSSVHLDPRFLYLMSHSKRFSNSFASCS